MKKFVLEFLRRGLVACGFGPIILALIYLILQRQGVVQTLNVDQVCMGIFSVTTLAFVAGGMNAIYQIEQLPLMVTILIHGGVLYFSYLVTYLLNNWLKDGLFPVLGFTVIFVLGYLVIWVIIYAIIRNRTARVNEMLKRKQQSGEN